MAVRVFNHSPHVVHTVMGVPIPSQGYADVPLTDVKIALEKGKLRLIADMDEVIPPIVVDIKSTEGLAYDPKTPITAVPAISQNEDGSSTIKSKRARSKRPSSAKE
mgnify:CR=1 FL=1